MYENMKQMNLIIVRTGPLVLVFIFSISISAVDWYATVRSTGSDNIFDGEVSFGWRKRRSILKTVESTDSQSESDEVRQILSPLSVCCGSDEISK